MKRLKPLWADTLIDWHTRRMRHHERMVEAVMIKAGMCPQCAGKEGKHFLNCEVWRGITR